MLTCDTLIIGGGYTAMGMALTCQNPLICEESEYCDPGFAMTLKRFCPEPYAPALAAGQQLRARFEELGLLSGGLQNCGALECVAAEFALDHGLRILLKSRVVHAGQLEDGSWQVILLTNSGLETVSASRVMDTRPGAGAAVFTLLFEAPCAEVFDWVREAFPLGTVEQGFYPGRGALHLPVDTADYNRALRTVCAQWEAMLPQVKILLPAPRLDVTPREPGSIPGDWAYRDPVAALEAGVRYGEMQWRETQWN